MTAEDPVTVLLAIADGREEYARALPEAGPMSDVRAILLTEAAAYRCAARIVSGDRSELWGLLPSWRWTPDMTHGTVGVVPVTE
jgi:hypothetical protein